MQVSIVSGSAVADGTYLNASQGVGEGIIIARQHAGQAFPAQQVLQAEGPLIPSALVPVLRQDKTVALVIDVVRPAGAGEFLRYHPPTGIVAVLVGEPFYFRAIARAAAPGAGGESFRQLRRQHSRETPRIVVEVVGVRIDCSSRVCRGLRQPALKHRQLAHVLEHPEGPAVLVLRAVHR